MHLAVCMDAFVQRLSQIVKSDLDLILSDNVKAWQMNADGMYSKINNDGGWNDGNVL